MVSKVNSEDVKKWHEITSPVESPSETLILVYRDEKKKNAGSCGTPGTPGTLF